MQVSIRRKNKKKSERQHKGFKCFKRSEREKAAAPRKLIK